MALVNAMNAGHMSEEADVVVVGGGPGGSTLATLIAMRGHRVVLLEKEKFPRYQIGESLLPSTVHGVCRLTGVADELAKAGFTKKRGGTLRWGANPEPWTFSFSVSPRMAGDTSHASRSSGASSIRSCSTTPGTWAWMSVSSTPSAT